MLLQPPIGLLRDIRRLLPFGAIRYPSPEDGAEFGLVMECGDWEIRGVKQQPADCNKEQNWINFEANSILIAHSLAGYVRRGFSGLFMPSAYFRDKNEGRYESGICYFAFPSPQGRECLEYPFEPAYDGELGYGFTAMMLGFIDELKRSSRETGITLSQPIGLDVRNRLQFGSVGFGFMVLGRHIICLKTRVSERDPVWTILRSTGIAEVFHVPSHGVAISEDQLSISKAAPSSS